MRIHLTFCLFCLMMFLSRDCNSQALVNWEWQEANAVSYVDIEYKNGFVYALGNFNDLNVVVGTNTFINNGATDFIIAKYDTLGNVIWVNHYGGTGVDELSNLTIDANDNICVVGTFNSTISIGSYTLYPLGGKDIIMVKLNSNGIVQMAKSLGGLGNDFGVDIATDYANNIYIVGNVDTMTFAGISCPKSSAIVKYSNIGTEVFLHWITGCDTLSGAASPYCDVASMKYSAFDSSLVLGGVFGVGVIARDGAISFPFGTFIENNGTFNQDIYLAKIKANGSWYFLRNLTTTSSMGNSLSDICIDEVGSIYTGQRSEYSLSGYSSNYWNKYNKYGVVITCVAGLSSGATWAGGSPGKMFYHDHMIYGIIMQSNLSTGVNCSDYYALQYDILTNSQSFISLVPYSYIGTGVAGVNGNYFLGGNSCIGKSCQSNCAVQAFSISPAPDVNICPNSNIQIGGNPCFYANGGTQSYNFSWQPTLGLSNPNISNPIVSNITSNMTYTVTISDMGTNIGYDTINVTLSNINYGNSTVTACNFYNWAGSNYNATGSYTHTFTNSSGCDSIHTLNLIVNLSNYQFSNISVCDSYNWNGATYTISGNYSNIFTNAVGCDSIINLTLTINTIDTSIVQVSNSLTANEVGATYQWLSCNPYAIIIGATNQSYLATANGDYAVIISKNACTDTSSCYQVSGVHVDNLIQENQFLVYPNPTHSIIYIQVQNTDFNKSNNEVLLCNTLGQVLQKQIINSNGKAEFNISHLSAGLYYIRCNRYCKKIIKE